MSYPIVRRCACGQQACNCGEVRPISMPHFDPDISNFIGQMGRNIVYDDRHDIYKLITRRHPHLNHHWISGSFMVVLGEMGNVMSRIGMFMQAFSERENGEQPLANIMNDFIGGMMQELPPELERSMQNMRHGVKGQRAIPLAQLREEMGPTRYSEKPLLSAPKPPRLI